MQNSLVGRYNCGRAVLGGTGPDAAGRGPAIHIGTGSGQPPYFGRNLPAWANSRPSGFSLLDRARPVFSFRRNRKEKMGGAMNQPSSWLKSPPPVRGSKSLPRAGGALTPPHRGQKCPHNHSLPQTPAARPASPGGFPPSGGTPPCSWPWTFDMSPAPPHGCGPRSCPDW